MFICVLSVCGCVVCESPLLSTLLAVNDLFPIPFLRFVYFFISILTLTLKANENKFNTKNLIRFDLNLHLCIIVNADG